MSSTFSNLKFELIGTGEQSGAWGTTTNANIGTAIEQAIVGMATLDSGDFTANVCTLALANTVAAQDARALCLNIASGAVSAAGTINVPAIQKPYLIINGSSFAVTVKVSGQTGVAVPAGKRTVVYNNGTDVGSQINWLAALDITTLNATTVDATTVEATNIRALDGTASITLANSTGVASFTANPVMSGGTANGVAYLNGSKVLTTGGALTFDGTNLVLGANKFIAKYSTGDSNGLNVFQDASDVSRIYNFYNAGLAFGVNNTEQMRLTSTGLGIGTSSPSQKLTVVGNLKSAGAQASNISKAIFTRTDNSWSINNETDLRFYTGSGDTDSPATIVATMTSTGNLLVGTTTAVERLTIGSGSATSAGVNLRTTQTDFSIVPSNSAAGGVNIATSWVSGGQGPLRFSNSAGEMGRFDSSGNLLVGQTSNPAVGKIAVTFSGTTTTGLELKDGTDAAGAGYIAFRNSSGGLAGSITRGTGNTVVYNTTSDYRLKTVIGPVADAGRRIDALQPVEYTWNSDGSRTRGFLAHQFQEVYAGSVTGSKDAVDAKGKPVYQAMQASSSEVIADLVAELKSLRARVLALESN